MGIVIRQSIKGTFVTYIGSCVGILVSLIILPRYLGDELIGLTRVLFEASAVFAIFFQLGASSSAMRFFPYFKSEDKKNNGFFFYLISLVTIGFILFIPLFFLLKDSIIHFFSDGSPLFIQYLYWLIPLTFFLIYWTTFELYSNILMRIAVPKFIREVGVKVLLILVYVSYGLGYLNLDGLIAAFVGIYGIPMLISFFYVSRIGSISLKHDSSFVSPALKKKILSYSSIILIGSLGATLGGKIEIFMISAEMSLASVGIYSIASFMSNVIEIPSRSISVISAPIAADALKRNDIETVRNLYKKVSLHQLLIGSSLFVLIWINIDSIYSIIELISGKDNFRAGKWVVFYLGLAKIIEITIGFGGTLISFSKHYKWNLFFTFFVTGVTIFLNWLLIPKLGISGSAIATLLTYIVVYGGLQLILVLVKVKVNPFSIGTIKILGVISLAFILNFLLPDLANTWINSIYKTLIISSISGFLIYFLNISEETNRIINSLFEKLKLYIKK